MFLNPLMAKGVSMGFWSTVRIQAGTIGGFSSTKPWRRLFPTSGRSRRFSPPSSTTSTTNTIYWCRMKRTSWQLQPKRWPTSCSRKPGRRRPPATLSFQRHRLCLEALNLFPGQNLLHLLLPIYFLCPTHLLLSTHPLPLRPIIRKPDPMGRPRGGTWIPPFGNFRLIPSERSRKDWKRCNTSTSGWSILPREPVRP